MSTTIVAKDLTKEFPRSPFEELGGFAWLPRLIDKTRALQAGKIGEYTPFPCGGDQAFLGALGIAPEAIKAQIDAGHSDEAIATWVKANLGEGWEARHDAWKQGCTQPTTGEAAGYLEGLKAELAKVKPAEQVAKVTNFGELICVEEGYPVPYWN